MAGHGDGDDILLVCHCRFTDVCVAYSKSGHRRTKIHQQLQHILLLFPLVIMLHFTKYFPVQ